MYELHSDHKVVCFGTSWVEEREIQKFDSNTFHATEMKMNTADSSSVFIIIADGFSSDCLMLGSLQKMLPDV